MLVGSIPHQNFAAASFLRYNQFVKKNWAKPSKIKGLPRFFFVQERQSPNDDWFLGLTSYLLPLHSYLKNVLGALGSKK